MGSIDNLPGFPAQEARVGVQEQLLSTKILHSEHNELFCSVLKPLSEKEVLSR